MGTSLGGVRARSHHVPHGGDSEACAGGVARLCTAGGVDDLLRWVCG